MSAFLLKSIAIVAMLIDHLAFALDGLIFFESTFALRAVGRIAFPIFAYFVGEGFRHTKNVNRYLMRLGAFALLSEIPFDMLFRNAGNVAKYGFGEGFVFLEFSHQNVFFTLFLGVLAAHLLKIGADRPITYVLAPMPIILGDALNTDFGSLGVLMVFACAVISWGKAYRLVALFLGGIAMFYPFYVFSPAYAYMLMAGYASALALLLCYNGKRGRSGRFVQWVFYLFYPIHLLGILGILWLIISILR